MVQGHQEGKGGPFLSVPRHGQRRERIPSVKICHQQGSHTPLRPTAEARGRQLHSNPQEQANLFASTFNLSDSNADLDDIEGAQYPHPLPPSEYPPFTEDEIERSLFGMNPKKAAGPDSITVRTLQKAWDSYSNIFCEILQACYDWASFPSAWLTSLTWVIRKPGKPNYSLPNAYRPIALLNTLGKVLEAVIGEAPVACGRETPSSSGPSIWRPTLSLHDRRNSHADGDSVPRMEPKTGWHHAVLGQ